MAGKRDIGHSPSLSTSSKPGSAAFLKPVVEAGAEPARRPITRSIIVVGGSAGSLEAFLSLARGLPADFPGSVLVVSHVGANRSHLPGLLAAAGPLPARHAEDGEPIRPGHIYVAPPDRHMLIDDGRIVLSRGPREHFTRPAIDPLFRSAARSHGAAVIGVVLSGGGGDGASGLEEIARAGGLTLVQEPSDALFPEMPRTAAAIIDVDQIVPSRRLAPLLTQLASEPAAAPARKAEASEDMQELEKPSALTCPDCGGALREMNGTSLKMYRCHTGHAFAADELLVQQLDEVERAVFIAVRVLNEHAELCGRMIFDAQRAGRTHGIAYWTRLKNEAETQLESLQRFLLRGRPDAAREDAAPPIAHSAQ